MLAIGAVRPYSTGSSASLVRRVVGELRSWGYAGLGWPFFFARDRPPVLRLREAPASTAGVIAPP